MPNDKLFYPFQQWTVKSDNVSKSPIGLLIHHKSGLFHTYRGAIVFNEDIPLNDNPVNQTDSPCLSCEKSQSCHLVQ